jgi:hypothetical protein
LEQRDFNKEGLEAYTDLLNETRQALIEERQE